MSKIIVLTPVKNEEWILDKFLSVCSLFADHIIIADQDSTDNSVVIAKKFDKVTLIKNSNKFFNESERQILLIDTARQLFGSGNVLLALDADEIASADSINSNGWDIIKKAPPGTVFRFEKPTIYFNEAKCIRYPDGWPLGYKDDGVKHQPTTIHSTRIPTPHYSNQILIEEIKFLHFCFVRKNVQFSKNRFYCVVENTQNVSNQFRRRLMYSKYKPEHYKNEGFLQSTNQSWFDYYDKIGINLRSFEQQEYYWMDFEVLRIFNKFGTKRFYNDSIWHFNWEACRKEALFRDLKDIPLEKIQVPSSIRIYLLDKFYMVLIVLVNIKRRYLNI